MPDVHHDEVAHLVARQQVPSAEPAERHGEIRSSNAVNHAGQQVYPGRTIDGNDGNLEIEHPGEQRGDGRPRRARRAGAE